MALKNVVEFCIDVKGELTGQQYTGAFTVRTKLSVMQALAQDELYRRILGVNSQEASETSKALASAISYLSTHVVKGPEWFTALEGLMKCEDINVVAAVNNEAQRVIDVEYKALSEEAKKAETALKALQPAQ
jgi:hypothetical protein